MLVATFHSPATTSAFTDAIPGSMFLAYHFASQPADSIARSAFQLCHRNRFAPIPAASSLQTRCSFTDQPSGPLLQPPLPSRSFTSFGIKAFDWACKLPIRLPNSPDALSLPAAVFYY
jgi:hypothetical protein